MHGIAAADVCRGYRVRDFQRTDQPAVRRLVRDGLADHWGAMDDRLNPDLDDIATASIGCVTVVARLGDDIVATGRAVMAGDTVEISRMSVRSDRRGESVGRLILDELVRRASGWGARRVVLETSSAWTETVAFYAACGFTITHVADGEFGSDTWFELVL